MIDVKVLKNDMVKSWLRGGKEALDTVIETLEVLEGDRGGEFTMSSTDFKRMIKNQNNSTYIKSLKGEENE